MYKSYMGAFFCQKSKMDPVEQAKVDERYLNGKIGIHQVGKEWGGYQSI